MKDNKQQLAQMVKSGKSQSMQASTRTVIGELRNDIECLEAQTHIYQSVYDDLVQEIKAKLEQRIKEVKDGVYI